MDFDWYGFYESIILVLIPTGIGAYTSKFLTNSWQERREKSRIKREILQEFKESIKNTYGLMFVFILKIMNYYTSHHGLMFNDKNEPMFEMDVSSSLNNLPSQKFSSEHEKLYEQFLQLEFTGSQFLSSLRLYYRNESFEGEYRNVSSFLNEVMFLILQMMEAKNGTELATRLLKCLQTQDNSRNLIKNFEEKLIDSDLHKLTL